MSINEGNGDTLAEVSCGDGALGSIGKGVPLYDGLLAAGLTGGGNHVELGVLAQAVVLDVEVGVVLEDRGVLAAGLELGVCAIDGRAVSNSDGRVVSEVVIVCGEVDNHVLEVVPVPIGGRQELVLVLVLGEVPGVHDAPGAVLQPTRTGIDLTGAGVALSRHVTSGLEAGAESELETLFLAGKVEDWYVLTRPCRPQLRREKGRNQSRL